MLAADSFKPGAKLEFHAGWTGWTRHPSWEGEGQTGLQMGGAGFRWF